MFPWTSKVLHGDVLEGESYNFRPGKIPPWVTEAPDNLIREAQDPRWKPGWSV